MLLFYGFRVIFFIRVRIEDVIVKCLGSLLLGGGGFVESEESIVGEDGSEFTH